jgi:tetratricopeptide (TPR) repeat protein
LAEQLRDAPGLAMSYQLLGNLARYRGQHARARDMFREAADRHHALGSWFWEAINLTQLADVLYESGEYETALALATENLAQFRVRGPGAALSRSLETLALLATARDDLATARALLEEGLAIEHAHGNRFGMVRSQLALGQALGAQENISEALQLLQESLRGAEYAGDRVAIARILEIIGRLLARSQPAPAVRLAAAAAALRASVGAPPNTPERADLDDWLAVVRQRSGAHEYASQWAVGLARSTADAVQEALRLIQARVPDHHAQTG